MNYEWGYILIGKHGLFTPQWFWDIRPIQRLGCKVKSYTVRTKK